MGPAQVADGGDGLQVWRVAEHIYNRSQRQPTRGGPPACASGESLTTPHCKNIPCYETKNKVSINTGYLTDLFLSG